MFTDILSILNFLYTNIIKSATFKKGEANIGYMRFRHAQLQEVVAATRYSCTVNRYSCSNYKAVQQGSYRHAHQEVVSTRTTTACSTRVQGRCGTTFHVWKMYLSIHNGQPIRSHHASGFSTTLNEQSVHRVTISEKGYTILLDTGDTMPIVRRDIIGRNKTLPSKIRLRMSTGERAENHRDAAVDIEIACRCCTHQVLVVGIAR